MRCDAMRCDAMRCDALLVLMIVTCTCISLFVPFFVLPISVTFSFPSFLSENSTNHAITFPSLLLLQLHKYYILLLMGLNFFFFFFIKYNKIAKTKVENENNIVLLKKKTEFQEAKISNEMILEEAIAR